MRLSALLLLSFVLSISVPTASKAAQVEVTGSGNIPGTTTVYTCTQFPEAPPFCPSQTQSSTFGFLIHETVDTTALASTPATFSGVQVGNFYFADFSIALVGTDQWGNDLFQGQNLTITGTDNLHPCLNSIYPCGSEQGTFSAATFSVVQTVPAPVPEPATWTMMLLGFASLGLAFHSRRRAARLASGRA